MFKNKFKQQQHTYCPKKVQISTKFQVSLFPGCSGCPRQVGTSGHTITQHDQLSTRALIYPSSPILKNSSIIHSKEAKYAVGLTTRSSNIFCPLHFWLTQSLFLATSEALVWRSHSVYNPGGKRKKSNKDMVKPRLCQSCCLSSKTYTQPKKYLGLEVILNQNLVNKLNVKNE